MLSDDALAALERRKAQPPTPATAAAATAPPAMAVRRSTRGPKSWLNDWRPFIADIPSDRCQDGVIVRIGTVAVPARQRKSLGLSEAERQVDLVDQHRNIDMTLLSPRRFVLDERPFGSDGPLAPHHDDAAGGVQLILDGLAPGGAAADLLIPPNGKSSA